MANFLTGRILHSFPHTPDNSLAYVVTPDFNGTNSFFFVESTIEGAPGSRT